MHVDSTGKNIAYLSKPCLSNERSGNSGGQRVYAWNVKMARNYPSPLENCLQLKTKLLMFILTIGHFFDDNIYSIVTRYYWKKNVKKKLTRTWLVTRTWLGLELDSCYDQTHSVLTQLPEEDRHDQLLLAQEARWRIIPSLHIQHTLWAV